MTPPPNDPTPAPRYDRDEAERLVSGPHNDLPRISTAELEAAARIVHALRSIRVDLRIDALAIASRLLIEGRIDDSVCAACGVVGAGMHTQACRAYGADRLQSEPSW